jgi:Ca2+/Na+ antiporter
MKYFNSLKTIAFMLLISILLRFALLDYIYDNQPLWIRILVIISIIVCGAIFGLRIAANIIEDTTGVISERTNLAGGFLQSLGTAFPDMVLGILAAVLSLQQRDINPDKALSYAILAASTTFGSNIYNIAHAYWCILRQNKANKLNKAILMFPGLKSGGSLKPFSLHQNLPMKSEFNTANSLLEILSLLTGFIAIMMVIFGKTEQTTATGGEIFQLIRPLGLILFLACLFVLYKYRKQDRLENSPLNTPDEPNIYHKSPTAYAWLSLFIAGVAILFCAESMVKALEEFSLITHINSSITGLAAGIIGCLGEMIVVHNFSVHPKGRIGDAVIGVAMDNIVTVFGAAIVALIGGIFLGSNSLIIIFILILCLNILLIREIEKLKDSI